MSQLISIISGVILCDNDIKCLYDHSLCQTVKTGVTCDIV